MITHLKALTISWFYKSYLHEDSFRLLVYAARDAKEKRFSSGLLSPPSLTLVN
jgi:hypothetical protein